MRLLAFLSVLITLAIYLWAEFVFAHQPNENEILLEMLIIMVLFAGFMVYNQITIRKLNKNLLDKVEEEITNSRKKDNLLFQQSKVASLGEMIGNISHQWRQPLSEIAMIENNILARLNNDTIEKEEIFNLILEEQRVIKKMSNTIESFEKLYRQDGGDESLRVSDILQRALDVISEKITLKNIELSKNIDQNERTIKANSGILGQAILTILQINISHLAQKTKDPKMDISVQNIEGFVRLSLESNCTFNDLFMSKVFDIDFSYKGLYFTKLIIENRLKGKLKVSRSDTKTQFTILLPV